MTNPLKTETSANLGLLLARVPVGVYFLLDGWTKFSGGVGAYVAMNLPDATHFLPDGAARGLLYAVPYAEVVAGLLLVLGLLSRVGGLLTAGVVAVFVLLAGGLQVSTNAPSPFTSQLILMGVAMLVLLVGPGRFSLDQRLFGRR